MEKVSVCSELESCELRQQATLLRKHFQAKFNEAPQFYVRVPGRVNIIGEHIDYSGFAVLPMAIELNLMVAVGFNADQTLNLTNVDGDKYEDFSTSINGFEIDKSKLKWHNYFLCGVKGIMEDSCISPKGMDVAVLGKIPPSAGLSSSSALVCAGAAATCYSNRVCMSLQTISNICARSERYVGTQGGGMDQAIAFFAESGAAKYIVFDPALLTATVQLPSHAVFVVANSCVTADKAATSLFNTRVAECKIAAKVLAKAFGLEASKIKRLKDVANRYYCKQRDTPHPMASGFLQKLSLEVKQHLHEEPYMRAEICEFLNISDNEFESLFLTDNTKNLEKFKLYQRACHVFEEASRVMNFKEICDAYAESISLTALEELGDLMLQSHRSCRDLYECSHPELDEFVEIAVNAGALGARLTGAGWGGCCIALVKEKNLTTFMEEVKSKYFMNHPRRSKDMQSNLFATQPGNRANVYTTTQV